MITPKVMIGNSSIDIESVSGVLSGGLALAETRLISTSSQASQSSDICRICHCESESYNPLLTPCYCSGSLKYVHQSCLQQWLTASETNYCELCKFPFIMHSKIKPLNEWKSLEMSGVERRRLCCAVLFHFAAALCVIWSLCVLIERAAEEVKRGLIGWPFWTKLVVVTVGLTGGVVFMYIQCKQYLHLCHRWRARNRLLLIQNAPERGQTMSSGEKRDECQENSRRISFAAVSNDIDNNTFNGSNFVLSSNQMGKPLSTLPKNAQTNANIESGCQIYDLEVPLDDLNQVSSYLLFANCSKNSTRSPENISTHKMGLSTSIPNINTNSENIENKISTSTILENYGKDLYVPNPSKACILASTSFQNAKECSNMFHRHSCTLPPRDVKSDCTTDLVRRYSETKLFDSGSLSNSNTPRIVIGIPRAQNLFSDAKPDDDKTEKGSFILRDKKQLNTFSNEADKYRKQKDIYLENEIPKYSLDLVNQIDFGNMENHNSQLIVFKSLPNLNQGFECIFKSNK